MNCPNCQHDNTNDARFCPQCGAPLTPPAAGTPTTQTPAAPAPQPAGRSNTGRIVLAVIVLLLLGIGIYAARHFLANTAATLETADTQASSRSNDSNTKAAGTGPGAPAPGNAIGSAVGTGAKGGSDPGKAPDNAPQGGPPVEQHDKSSGSTNGTPDAAAAGQASTAMGGLLGALSSAVGGVHRHDPVDFHTLEALLPSSLPDMQPATPDGNADETMSIKSTSAHVDFNGPNEARIKLSIKDATAISGLAGLANMANSDESEQGDSYEKSEIVGGRSVHEKWDAPARHGELSLSVGERFAVDVVGDNVAMEALKSALAHIDLAKLESMKDANPITK